MRIHYGLSSGMVMQRAANGCDIRFSAEHCGELRSSLGQLQALPGDCFRLTGIAPGGPYRLTLSDDEDAVSIDGFYVGDVWVLAGQSNMEGAARRRQTELAYDAHPDEQIRAYGFSDEWSAARSLLHEQWLNTDQGVREKYWRDNTRFLELYGGFSRGEPASGVGPGLYIGRRLRELTDLPQGLIPCAYGGSNLRDWSPDNRTPASLYRSMLRRVRDCGGRVRGVFWYQGEAETGSEGIERFMDNMRRLIEALRSDLGDAQLPFVQAQIAQTALPQYANPECSAHWYRIRVLQSQMPTQIPRTATVSTANAYLQDLIHIDAQSQAELGKTMAEEMHRLLTGEGIPLPQVERITVEADPLKKNMQRIRVKYRHAAGGLVSAGRPYGFSVTRDDETPYEYPYRCIDRIDLEGDTAVLTVESAYVDVRRARVWYGAGFNSVCSITDALGRALPADVYPVRLDR